METAIERRALLGRMLVGAAAVAVLPHAGHAQSLGSGDPKAPIETLNAALLAAMQAGARSTVSQRFDIIAPAVDQTFDLQTVLQNSVGLRWASLPDAEKQRLGGTFRRYTICSYAASFDHWSGQKFRIDANPRAVSATQVVVRSWLVPASGSPLSWAI